MDGKLIRKTVEKYLEALTESYIIYQAKRYNIKGKQYLKTLEKYYVVDIGLRYMLLGSRQMGCGAYSGKCGVSGTAPQGI